jgi:tetratricopeptide (TPR) repeat protein
MPSSLTLQIKSILEKIEENPYDGDLYFNVAVLQQRNGDCDEAIHNYSCAISYKTNIAEAYFRLAQLCNKLNNIDLAIAHINEAIINNNTIAKYFELLGNLRWKKSEIDEAENNYLKCIQLAPESPRPHFRLSKIYESQELLHKAIDEIELAVLFDGKNPLYLYQYSELMVKTGVLDKAVKYKREAQLLAPEKYSFIYEDIVARCMLYSGEVVVIPVGFRCYTKGKLYKSLSFKQSSLPFDSVFFPSSSISSFLKSSRIKLDMNSHTVCIKN